MTAMTVSKGFITHFTLTGAANDRNEATIAVTDISRPLGSPKQDLQLSRLNRTTFGLKHDVAFVENE